MFVIFKTSTVFRLVLPRPRRMKWTLAIGGKRSKSWNVLNWNKSRLSRLNGRNDQSRKWRQAFNRNRIETVLVTILIRVSTITSRKLRIRVEHVYRFCSLESGQSFGSVQWYPSDRPLWKVFTDLGTICVNSRHFRIQDSKNHGFFIHLSQCQFVWML